MPDFLTSHSGGVSPINNDQRLDGTKGLMTTWYTFQLPGAPTHVKIHLRDLRSGTEVPNFKAVVAAKSKAPNLAALKASEFFLPDTGLAGWLPVTWAGADHVAGPEVHTGLPISQPKNACGEVVSDAIPVTATKLADGTSYFVMAVEQTNPNANFAKWFSGGIPEATTVAPRIKALNGLALADKASYWLDLYMCSDVIAGITNAATNKGIPAKFATNDAMTGLNATPWGSGIGAWLEPVYAEDIRSFLSTGDSTHSAANGLETFDGWEGRAIRSFMTPTQIVTHQQAGGSGHSFDEFMNIFDELNSHSDYTDLVLQGWSQNGFTQTAEGAQHIIDEITKRVTAAKAKKQRVYITTGYGVDGYTGTNVFRAQTITGIKALADEVNGIYVVDTDALITDYSASPFGQGGHQPIKDLYKLKRQEDDRMTMDGVHSNLAGQAVMMKALADKIALTFDTPPTVPDFTTFFPATSLVSAQQLKVDGIGNKVVNGKIQGTAVNKKAAVGVDSVIPLEYGVENPTLKTPTTVKVDKTTVATATIVGSEIHVHGVAVGTAMLTVQQDNYTLGINLTVEAAPPVTTPVVPDLAAIVVDKDTVTVQVNGHETVVASPNPGGAQLGTLTVTSDHPEIAAATVNGRTITIGGVGAGTARITVSSGTITKVITVTVPTPVVNPGGTGSGTVTQPGVKPIIQPEDTPRTIATGVSMHAPTIQDGNIELEANEYHAVRIESVPDYVGFNEVRASSSDDSVVGVSVVSNRRIFLITRKEGQAIISINADGLNKQLVVTVTPDTPAEHPAIPVTAIAVSGPTLTGNDLTIEAATYNFLHVEGIPDYAALDIKNVSVSDPDNMICVMMGERLMVATRKPGAGTVTLVHMEGNQPIVKTLNVTAS